LDDIDVNMIRLDDKDTALSDSDDNVEVSNDDSVSNQPPGSAVVDVSRDAADSNLLPCTADVDSTHSDSVNKLSQPTTTAKKHLTGYMCHFNICFFVYL